MDHSNAINDSWQANAGNWIATIDNAEIETRVLVTNSAIVNAVCATGVHSILDIGCGEGWLTRALREKGIDVFGVDMIPALIQNAIEKGGDHYAVASFKELAEGSFKRAGKSAAAVINFALLDKNDTELLLKNIRQLIVPGGLVIIQTLHPSALTQEPYVSGWKEGSWRGLKRDFEKPYDWYFRTLGDWTTLFAAAGLIIQKIEEPLHPETQRPASIIFVLKDNI